MYNSANSIRAKMEARMLKAFMYKEANCTLESILEDLEATHLRSDLFGEDHYLLENYIVKRDVNAYGGFSAHQITKDESAKLAQYTKKFDFSFVREVAPYRGINGVVYQRGGTEYIFSTWQHVYCWFDALEIQFTAFCEQRMAESDDVKRLEYEAS